MTPSYSVVVAPRARKDLIGIGGPAAVASSPHASKLLQAIFAGFDSLRLFPLRNVVSLQPPTQQPPIRSLPIRPYIVYFRVYEDTKVVRVTRV